MFYVLKILLLPEYETSNQIDHFKSSLVNARCAETVGQTHKKRCHYGTMYCVEQMGFHTHPTATEGKTYQSVLSAAQSTHAHTHAKTRTLPASR